MSLNKLLRTKLTADAGVAALVATRVHPVKLPQAITFPAVTFLRISAQRTSSQDGPSGLARPRVEINAWAKTADEAEAVHEAIRHALDGFRGPVPGSEFVYRIELITDRTSYESDTLLFRYVGDYYVWHEEN